MVRPPSAEALAGRARSAPAAANALRRAPPPEMAEQAPPRRTPVYAGSYERQHACHGGSAGRRAARGGDLRVALPRMLTKQPPHVQRQCRRTSCPRRVSVSPSPPDAQPAPVYRNAIMPSAQVVETPSPLRGTSIALEGGAHGDSMSPKLPSLCLSSLQRQDLPPCPSPYSRSRPPAAE